MSTQPLPAIFVWDGLVMPPHLIRSFERYVNERIETGKFLRSVLENDLNQAVCRADYMNFRLLPVIVRYVYNELPSTCWGDKEKVAAWLKKAEEA
jgi:hypothetical protein